MNNPEEKPGENPDEKEAKTINYIITGDYIEGDKTSVGDITDSEGIAVGSGASAAVEKGSKPTAGAGAGAGGQALDARAIYKLIVEKFNLAEIQELCFDLAIDFEDLGGSGKRGKARELVTYVERRGRLEELYAAIQAARG